MSNTCIFSFVRMNPPTPGHLLLIKTMIDTAIELGAPRVYVLLSKSVDEKNPLPCDTETIPMSYTDSNSNLTNKSNILNGMLINYKANLIADEPDLTKKDKLNNLEIKVLCATGNTFSMISGIINTDFIKNGVNPVKLYMVVGSDRADFLASIKKFFKTNPNIESVEGNILDRDLDGDAANNLAAMSATHVRGLVKANNFSDFQNIYNNYLNGDQIKELYDSIGLGLQMNQPTEGKKRANDVIDVPPAKSTRISGSRISSRITRSSRHEGGRKRRITRKNKRNKRNKKTKRSYSLKTR